MSGAGPGAYVVRGAQKWPVGSHTPRAHPGWLVRGETTTAARLNGRSFLLLASCVPKAQARRQRSHRRGAVGCSKGGHHCQCQQQRPCATPHPEYCRAQARSLRRVEQQQRTRCDAEKTAEPLGRPGAVSGREMQVNKIRAAHFLRGVAKVLAR